MEYNFSKKSYVEREKRAMSDSPLYCEMEDCCFWEEDEINEGSDLPVLNCTHPNIGLRDVAKTCPYYRLDWKKKRGFTLIEVLIVVGIIAIIALIAIPNVIKHLAYAKQTACDAFIQTLDTPIEQFKSDVGIYPDPYTYSDLPNTLYAWLTEDPFRGIDSNHAYFPYRGRWKGPYFKFRQKDIVTDGSFEKIEFYEGGEPQVIQDTRNLTQIVDAYNQPLVYIPSTSYSRYGAVVSDNTTSTGETQYFNPTSYQLISFGSDGKSLRTKMGGLSWNDNKDNDGDGLVDGNDNFKQAKISENNEYIEDDLNNF